MFIRSVAESDQKGLPLKSKPSKNRFGEYQSTPCERETGISVRSMECLVHDNLKMSSFSLQKGQPLSETVRQKKFEIRKFSK